MSALRLGVNLLWMVHGVVGGSETYTVSQLDALASEAADEVELVLFALPELLTAHPDLARRWPTVLAPISGRRKPLRVAAETTWLAAQARRHGIGLMAHPGGTIPRRPGTRTALTIHDLQWVTYPEYFSRAKLAYVRLAVPSSIRRADVVIANSRFVAGTIADHTGVALEGIHVVPPAVGQAAVPQAPGAPLPPGIGDRPFFLYPAITYPHKNHAVLLEALATIPAAEQPDLVFTGGVAQAEDAVASAARRLGVAARVHRLGRVPAAELDALYRAAVGLVFPSRYEGFGMGVAEAMARDCPVIAAAATALPEVVADAGLLVEPVDPAGWAAAMRQLLDDGTLRDRLIDAGRARLASFSPAAVAAELVAAYRSAAAAS